MSDIAIISVLEEKIDELISYIIRLEEERKGLLNQIHEKDARISDLEGKLNTLENERAEVGRRVEHILEKLGRISSEGQEVEGQGGNFIDSETGSPEGDFQFADTD